MTKMQKASILFLSGALATGGVFVVQSDNVVGFVMMVAGGMPFFLTLSRPTKRK